MSIKKSLLRVAFVAALLLLLLPSSAFGDMVNVTSDVGSYHVMWTWNESWNPDYTVVYVDGAVINVGENVSFYVLSNLNPGEMHRMDVYNTSTHAFTTSVVTTEKSLHQVFLIITVIIVCVCLGMLLSIFPLLGFLLATGLLVYLIENMFDGWLILFVGLLWVVCLLFGAERLSNDFGKYVKTWKRKRK